MDIEEKIRSLEDVLMNTWVRTKKFSIEKCQQAVSFARKLVSRIPHEIKTEDAEKEVQPDVLGEMEEEKYLIKTPDGYRMGPRMALIMGYPVRCPNTNSYR